MNETESLVLNALVSYADSCTLPSLTPTCPFYEESAGEARCKEQCREIISSRGGGSRNIIETTFGGLVMQGRELPVEAVAGQSQFDATQLYLEQRSLPLERQGTTSLLLSLRAILIEHIMTGNPGNLPNATNIWGALSRRLGNMDAVLSGGLARSMADAVTARVIFELLQAENPDEPEKPAESLDRDRTWLQAARTAFERQSAPSVRRQARARTQLESAALFSEFVNSKAVVAKLSRLPIFEYIHSLEFRHLVECWFEQLADHDLGATLSGLTPHAPIFAALTASPSRNEQALWLWERFTLTDLEEWNYSSLVLEWAWTQDGNPGNCDPRSLAERTVQPELLSELAMQRAARVTRQRAPEQRTFREEAFSNRASEFLINGEWEKACGIFEGLVELLPGDPGVWNNLGFCQLADNPEVALKSLQRASLLSATPSLLQETNQALALHLLRRDEEALVQAEKSLELSGEDSPFGAYLWAHPVPGDDDELELTTRTDVTEYARELRDHIAGGNCTSVHHPSEAPASR